MRVLLSLAFVSLSAAAWGQDAAPALDDFLTQVAGREVALDGHIGTGLNMMDNEALAFRSLGGTAFPVVFDAGRDARRQLEGCRFAMFGGGSPCRMTGQAELEWDGAQLRLIIFAVDSIEPPARLD